MWFFDYTPWRLRNADSTTRLIIPLVSVGLGILGKFLSNSRVLESNEQTTVSEEPDVPSDPAGLGTFDTPSAPEEPLIPDEPELPDVPDEPRTELNNLENRRTSQFNLDESYDQPLRKRFNKGEDEGKDRISVLDNQEAEGIEEVSEGSINTSQFNSDLSKEPVLNNHSVLSDKDFKTLIRLKELLDKGILTEEEFLIGKSKVFDTTTIPEKIDQKNNENAITLNHKEIELITRLRTLIEDNRHQFFKTFKSEIKELIDEIFINKDSMKIEFFLLNYQQIYSEDLIDQIKELSSSYETKKRYLSIFIEKGYLQKYYPHKKI